LKHAGSGHCEESSDAAISLASTSKRIAAVASLHPNDSFSLAWYRLK
jgi:hypothetical protein